MVLLLGRPDYLVNNNGALGAFLNIGKPKTIEGIKWEGVGQIASGFGTNDISIADINGDGTSNVTTILVNVNLVSGPGRSDYLLWDGKGSIEGYLNYRTEKEVCFFCKSLARALTDTDSGGKGQPGWAHTGPMGSVSGNFGTGKPTIYYRLADFNGDVHIPL